MVLGHDLSEGHRTQDVRISEDVSFETMLLKNATYKGLKKAGFNKPSPIQLHGIPLGKCGFDLLLEAKSGTGKTAVFTVIALDKLELDKGLQTIVLAPTREIASQISSVIAEIGSQYKGLNVAVVMGGLPIREDIEKFKENVHIVVGSPGRLRHLIQDKHINVSGVRLFVLDEADKLMESSFQPDVNYIFSLLPKQKQVIMSSATYSEETKSFIAKYVQKAQHICPDSSSILLGIEQKVTIVPYNSNIVKQTKHRYEELKKILNEKQFKQCLIFCNYQVRVGELHRMLTKDKWPVEQLYGQQEQTDRLDALKTLQEYKCRILVSTDLAARGIDASNVDVVINFEPPYEWQTYLHRIGRAGRYGSYGIAISILSEKEKIKLKETLGHMTFDIRGLWDDEPFNLSLNLDDDFHKKNQTLHKMPSDTTGSVNGDKAEDLLWKALTMESFEQSPEIYSFDGLCDSLKTSTIASFSDLINSFKEEQHKVHENGFNSDYKHVNVTNLPTEGVKYLNNLDNEHNYSPNSTQSNIEISDVHIKINGDSLTKEKSTCKKIDKSLIECLDEKSSKPDNNQRKNLQICLDKANNLQECVKQKQNLQSHKIEIDGNKQALLDAGLPTAFGKVKQNKSYHSYNSKNKNEITLDNFKAKPLIQQSPIKAQNNDRKEVKKIHSSKTFNVPNKVRQSDQSESTSDTGEKSNHFCYSSKTNAVNPAKGLKFESSTFNVVHHFQNNTNKHKNRKQNREKDFDLWYNQLKYQMHFIQYTLYIEELRKLN